MLDALDSSPANGMAMGTLGAVMGRSREQEMAQRANAIQQGRKVTSRQDIESKVRGVAEDFVSLFMNQVMKSMRATVQENPSMHGGNGEKFFQEMLDAEQSKYLAKGSGYGLTDLVYQSLMTKLNVTAPVTEETQPSGDPAQTGLQAEPVAATVL